MPASSTFRRSKSFRPRSGTRSFGAQPFGGVPRHEGRVQRHEGAQVRAHHQRRLGARARRLAVQVGLCRREAWRRRLTKVTALEGAEFNVTANAICPGYVWTPLVEKQIEDQAKAHNIPREQVIRDVLLVNQPNKKFATVEEMGALAVFLSSDFAASITGTALPVDGGWTAH